MAELLDESLIEKGVKRVFGLILSGRADQALQEAQALPAEEGREAVVAAVETGQSVRPLVEGDAPEIKVG